jgi:UDP-N-acetylmuramate dehydrogenase
VVIADDGFPGTVVHVVTRGVERNGDEFEVQAGEPWDAFVAARVEEGMAGVECLSGIPGSIGATPIQNVGAYGQEWPRSSRPCVCSSGDRAGRRALAG